MAETDQVARATGLPFRQAIAFLAAKANVTSTSWTDVWQKANARSFTVAGAATTALVEDFREEVRKALADGTTLQDFRKRFDEIVAKHGWKHRGKPGWRARVIYETNLSMAYSAGRYQQQTQPLTLQLFPFWQYVHSGARHPRLEHLKWNGTVLRADDPFWQKAYPPNGWGCGCWVKILSRRDLARSGRDRPDTAPDLEATSWTDKKTGEIKPATIGIDPGFDYNPGKEWEAIRAERAAPPAPDLPVGAPEIAAAAAVRKQFETWAKGLSRSETSALMDYKSSAGFLMNEHLRGIERFDALEPKIALVQTALTRGALSERTTLYRAEMADGSFAGGAPGEIITLPGFGSFTLDKAEALDRFQKDGVVIMISAPAGTMGALLGAMPQVGLDAEAEFLLPHGRRFRILSREGRMITAELLDD